MTKRSSTPCPKCHYISKPHDSGVMHGICPKCGIAYSKWKLKQNNPPEDGQASQEQEVGPSVKAQLKEAFLYVPKVTDTLSIWWRAILAGLFAIWGLAFIWAGVDWAFIGSSFLHNANLPFHEFGHVLFSPFGRFMAILGGSLFQILMPLIALAAFTFQQRDNFAASIMLWWCGQNFIDVAPYIKDAPHRAIPLIRGMGEQAHDWGNLLTMTNSLDSASALANGSFLIGCLLMIASISWAVVLLRTMYLSLQPNN